MDPDGKLVSGMSLTAISGIGLGVLFGGSLLLLVAALAGWRPSRNAGGGDRGRRGGVLWDKPARRRALIGIGVGLVVAVVTRWPVAAIAAGAMVYLWPTMFGAGRAASNQIERLEALTVWTESLRDSIAGSMGLEQAVTHSLHTSPPVLQPALQRMHGRMKVQMPLPEALAGFAEEFDDPSADLVIAALILNSRLRGPGLGRTLSELAVSAREQLEMRRKVEEGRKVLRRTALMVIGITAAFAGAVSVLQRDYVEPYSTPVGQLVLAAVLGIFGGGLMWIRAAATERQPERFLVDVDQIENAVQPLASTGEGR
jgi:tight adherence protein B